MQKFQLRKVRIFLREYCKNSENSSLLMRKSTYQKFLKNYGLDDNSIAAALLYDIDDGKKLGDAVSELISGLRKFDELALKASNKNREEKTRKMLIATTPDLRVLIVKLLEKLHAMRNFSNIDGAEQNKISREALEIYAPIAYRLGLSDVKWELEDLSFKHLMSEEYYRIKWGVQAKRKFREKIVRDLKRKLENALRKNRIEGEVFGRPKHFYSIYRKMVNKKKKFEDIHDLIGLRVIVEDSDSCYAALGIVNNLWETLPERFKDFIVAPKDNLYQSLHAGFTYDNMPVEVQIRTRRMNDIAEEGIAAHWKYKGLKDVKFNKQLSWLRQILSFANESDKEFLYKLKLDIFGDKIFCFTPKGDIIELDDGSSVVDFAYAVHSDVGNACTGAKVNGRFVGVRHVLKNGDDVEILTSKSHKPSRDWLSFVKTSKALEKIRNTLQIRQGAYNRTTAEGNNKSFITADGNFNIEVAKCCSPIPMDTIIGSLSSFRNVVVHSEKCRNAASIKNIVNVYWIEGFRGIVSVIIFADDRLGLFAEILNSVASLGINVKSAKAHSIGSDIAECVLNIEFDSLKSVKDVVDRVSKINSVRRVRIE
ncbi:bifunctional (p)ppGpp synthetase/guanosine-3',5'-bis(diphosphate) 3'-pyrophosphohydrolase [Candidatus Woesearchaeota archaeon]|nr:bifunctional (p)ppGpp synthetase/guanosine-3',5'-bis(diphosphate) 3'-pyrophosphohydrolase [Candidatus Woesearchaeota archaeon]